MEPSSALRLAIVVLNWNRADLTIACLESIAAARREGIAAIVVDNGSRGEDAQRVERFVTRLPWATFVRNSENLGFAEGCNVGIRIALDRGAALVMLLNNDAVLEPGALDLLLAHFDARPGVGLASPLILDGTGERIWAAGGRLARREVVCILHLTGRPATAAPADPFEVPALTGCALIARREVFESIGLLDAFYFAYVEDVDFSHRARAAGWRLEVVPAARVRHAVSASSGGGYTPLRSYLLGRGTGLFVRRHGSAGQRLGFAVAAPLGLLAASIREVPRGNGAAIVAKLRGYVDGLLGRPVDRRYLSG